MIIQCLFGVVRSRNYEKMENTIPTQKYIHITYRIALVNSCTKLVLSGVESLGLLSGVYKKSKGNSYQHIYHYMNCKLRRSILETNFS